MSERSREFVSSRRQDIKITKNFRQNPLRSQAKKAIVSSPLSGFHHGVSLFPYRTSTPGGPDFLRTRVSWNPQHHTGKPCNGPFAHASAFRLRIEINHSGRSRNRAITERKLEDETTRQLEEDFLSTVRGDGPRQAREAGRRQSSYGVTEYSTFVILPGYFELPLGALFIENQECRIGSEAERLPRFRLYFFRAVHVAGGPATVGWVMVPDIVLPSADISPVTVPMPSMNPASSREPFIWPWKLPIILPSSGWSSPFTDLEPSGASYTLNLIFPQEY